MADVSSLTDGNVILEADKSYDLVTKRDILLQVLMGKNSFSLLLLKGGELGGLRLKPKIIKQLNNDFVITEGKKWKVSVSEIVQRWGASDTLRKLLLQIEYSRSLQHEFAERAKVIAETGIRKGDTEWLVELSKVDASDPICQMLSFSLDYLGRLSQHLLLKRVTPKRELLNTHNLTPTQAGELVGGIDPFEVPEQEFVKKVIVGATNPYQAHPSSLRGSLIRKEIEDGVLKKLLTHSARFGLRDIEPVASIGNAVHVSSTDELSTEVDLLGQENLCTFFKAIVEEKKL